MLTKEEGMMRKQAYVANTASSALAMHKDSQRISKIKPKIRIIHIFAPEIIKTDVANFRELVQRLTGKPTETNTRKKPRTRLRRKEEARGIREKVSFQEGIKGKGDMWGVNENSNSGGFLGGFADLDGFMQELNQFPMLPLDASSHMDIALGGERNSLFA